MRRKVVVTGAAGFIGSHQCELLLEEGHEVVGIDNFHPYYSEKIKRMNLSEVERKAEESEGDFRFVNGSILESEDLAELPTNPEWIFHYAAVAGTRSSLDNPSEYFRVNVHGTSTLIEHFDDLEKFVFASSSSVYGDISEEQLPVREERELQPETPYSLSKHNAEKLVRMCSDLYGFDHAILRPFTVFGPRQRPDEVFTKFISRALKGEKVSIYGDGTQSRDYTYVGDVVRGALKTAKHGEGVYNIANQRRLTVEEVVDAMEKAMEEDVKRVYVDEHPGDVSHTHADISKAEKEIDYSPETDVHTGAKRSVRWLKKSGVLDHL